jgi:hypothetical protein
MISINEYKKLVPKKNKYKANPTTIDGIRFQSKKEAQYYQKLKKDQSDRLIKYFLMQIPFRLPGNTKYLLDFMVVYHDPHYYMEYIEYIDVKGYMTPVSKIKIKQVEDIYGIEIKLV